jgi:hypothetical protein
VVLERSSVTVLALLITLHKPVRPVATGIWFYFFFTMFEFGFGFNISQSSFTPFIAVVIPSTILHFLLLIIT